MLSSLFLVSDLLLFSQLENGLALTTKGYCVAVRVDPATGRILEVPKLLHTVFAIFLLAAVVLPPVLWLVVLLLWWRFRKSPPEVFVRP